jgi:hypothetical protein
MQKSATATPTKRKSIPTYINTSVHEPLLDFLLLSNSGTSDGAAAVLGHCVVATCTPRRNVCVVGLVLVVVVLISEVALLEGAAVADVVADAVVATNESEKPITGSYMATSANFGKRKVKMADSPAVVILG